MARVAIIATDSFEDSELDTPRQALTDDGHEVEVLGPEAGADIVGKQGEVKVAVDRAIADADPDRYDLLIVPGGYSPDKLRLDTDAVRFVHRFDGTGKPLAAICHAGSLLIDAAVVKGRTLTSWPSIRVDLVNAGAKWEDRELVEDGNLITSRKPDDLPAFVGAIRDRLTGSGGGGAS